MRIQDKEYIPLSAETLWSNWESHIEYHSNLFCGESDNSLANSLDASEIQTRIKLIIYNKNKTIKNIAYKIYFFKGNKLKVAK